MAEIFQEIDLGFPVEIAQRFAYVSIKHCTKFRCFCALMRKSYFAQILKKMLVFAYISLFPAISLFRKISETNPGNDE